MGSALCRRDVLAGLAGLGATSLSGCTASGSATRVSVLSAGSLSVLFDETVGPSFESATEFGYRGEFHGSKAVMRMLLDGQKFPDVVVSADAGLLRDRLIPDIATWDVVFATNGLVVPYNPDTMVGERLANGDPWYRVLAETEADIAISDPELDPLGYRTLQLFDLAEDYYDVEDLGEAIRANTVVDPQEAHLLAGVETGERAAAFAYKNMAVDHDLPFVLLPTALDFSDPSRSEHYATATYTTADGTTLHGTPIKYSVTVPTEASNPTAGERFVRFLLSNPDLLRANGLVVPDGFPVSHGSVPPEVMS